MIQNEFVQGLLHNHLHNLLPVSVNGQGELCNRLKVL